MNAYSVVKELCSYRDLISGQLLLFLTNVAREAQKHDHKVSVWGQ